MRYGVTGGNGTLRFFGVCPLTCILRSLSQVAVQHCKYPRGPVEGKSAFRAVQLSTMLGVGFSGLCPVLDSSSVLRGTLLCTSAPELVVERQKGADGIHVQSSCLVCHSCELPKWKNKVTVFCEFILIFMR